MRLLHFGKLLFIFLLLMPMFSLAANYKVTPLVFDEEVKPRDIFSKTVTITNRENRKIIIYPSVNEVNIAEGGDVKSFEPQSTSDNTQTPTSWIAFSRARLEIEANETVTLPLNFKIHPEAKAGVYHLFVGFGSGHNRPIAEAQVKSGVAPGVIVTLSVEQKQSEFLKLSKFLIKRFVTSPENDAISYTLTNPGEAVVNPKGEIIFSNSIGEEVAAVPINPDQEPLAPGQETTYVISAPTKDMMGKYKAFLTIDYGTTQLASVYDTAFFYVIPWQKLAILFGSVLFVTLFITILLHRRLQGRGDDDFDHDELPLFIKKTKSEDMEHDIILKK
jgi:hypothetical protein